MEAPALCNTRRLQSTPSTFATCAPHACRRMPRAAIAGAADEVALLASRQGLRLPDEVLRLAARACLPEEMSVPQAGEPAGKKALKEAEAAFKRLGWRKVVPAPAAAN